MYLVYFKREEKGKDMKRDYILEMGLKYQERKDGKSLSSVAFH